MKHLQVKFYNKHDNIYIHLDNWVLKLEFSQWTLVLNKTEKQTESCYDVLIFTLLNQHPSYIHPYLLVFAIFNHCITDAESRTFL